MSNLKDIYAGEQINCLDYKYRIFLLDFICGISRNCFSIELYEVKQEFTLEKHSVNLKFLIFVFKDNCS
jgi:hypothetical protein